MIVADSGVTDTTAGTTRRDFVITSLWGLAEATFFFIVPDVWLTRIAVKRGLKAALLNCLSALVGALIGGTLVWLCAQQAAPAIAGFFDKLPGISADMISQVRSSLETHGTTAFFRGAASGVPYKLFALQSAALGLGLPAFLVVSAFARLGRFALTSFLAWFVALALRPRLSTRGLLWLHTLAWLAFYAFYFSVNRG